MYIALWDLTTLQVKREIKIEHLHFQPTTTTKRLLLKTPFLINSADKWQYLTTKTRHKNLNYVLSQLSHGEPKDMNLNALTSDWSFNSKKHVSCIQQLKIFTKQAACLAFNTEKCNQKASYSLFNMVYIAPRLLLRIDTWMKQKPS